MTQEQTNTVKEIFFEEVMPQVNETGVLNESFDEKLFQNKEEIIKDLKDFWILSSQYQKKMVKNLPLILEKITHDNILFCIKCLYIDNQKVIQDNSDLSIVLLEQQKLLFTYCNTKQQVDCIQQSLEEIQRILVTFMELAITSNQKTLTFKAKTTILENKEFFVDAIYNQQILVLILNLLNSPQGELNKVTGLQLLALLHKKFNSENISGFISQSIYSETQAIEDRIRIEAYTTFFKILDSLPHEFLIEKGLKMIEKMNKDKTNEIRMIFAWNLPKMATCLPFYHFNIKCIPVFLKNFKSKNRFIREDSLQVVGQTLSALLQKNSTEMKDMFSSQTNIFKIIEAFYNIPVFVKKFQFHAKKNILKGNIKYMKDILQIQPLDSWNQINKFMDKISQLDKETVEVAKIELAKQFGEITKCIPDNKKKTFILRVKQEYLTVSNKTSPKTRETTLQILCEVLKELDQELREPFAEEYAQIIFNDVNKWRFKYVITTQFGILSTLFSPQTVHQFLLPVFFSLCRDDCFIVRKNASYNVYQILQNISSGIPEDILNVQIVAFGNYQRFSLRQSFIYIMEGILTHCADKATKEMIDILIQMANDPVLNNQICLSRLLLMCTQKQIYFEWFEKIFNKLVTVLDKDLLDILMSAYSKDDVKMNLIRKNQNILQQQNKKAKEDEKSYISLLKSESEAESENDIQNTSSILKELDDKNEQQTRTQENDSQKKSFDYIEGLADNFYEYSLEKILDNLKYN